MPLNMPAPMDSPMPGMVEEETESSPVLDAIEEIRQLCDEVEAELAGKKKSKPPEALAVEVQVPAKGSEEEV